MGLLAAGLLLMTIAACSTKDEQAQLIPKDNLVVAMFDTKDIFSKAKEDKLAVQAVEKLTQQLEKNISTINKDNGKLLLNAIDKTGNVYTFITPQKEGYSIFGLSFKLTDHKSLESWLEKTTKDDLTKMSVGDYHVYSTTKYSSSTGLAFNDKIALFFHIENLPSLSEKTMDEVRLQTYALLKNILQTKAEDSFTSTDEFKQMMDKKGEIKLAVRGDLSYQNSSLNYLPLPPALTAGIAHLEEKGKNMYQLIGVEANNGETLITSTSYFKTKETEEFYKMFQDSFKPMSNKLLSLQPKESILLAGAGINMADFYSSLFKTFPGLATGMNNTFDKLEPITNSNEITNILSSINGDLVFSLFGNAMQLIGGHPQWKMMCQLSNPIPLQQFLMKIEKQSLNNFIKVGNNQYILKATRNQTFSVGFRDNIFYISNLTMDEVFATPKENILDAEFASDIKKKKGTLVVNLSETIDLVKPLIVATLSKQKGGQSILTLLQDLDYLSIYQTKNNENIIKLKTKSDKNIYSILLTASSEAIN